MEAVIFLKEKIQEKRQEYLQKLQEEEKIWQKVVEALFKAKRLKDLKSIKERFHKKVYISITNRAVKPLPENIEFVVQRKVQGFNVKIKMENGYISRLKLNQFFSQTPSLKDLREIIRLIIENRRIIGSLAFKFPEVVLRYDYSLLYLETKIANFRKFLPLIPEFEKEGLYIRVITESGSIYTQSENCWEQVVEKVLRKKLNCSFYFDSYMKALKLTPEDELEFFDGYNEERIKSVAQEVLSYIKGFPVIVRDIFVEDNTVVVMF